jgi:hypothetical protein
LPKAFGPKGQSGDPARIVYVAKRLADIYRSALEWPQRFHRYAVPQELANVMRLCGSAGSAVAQSIRDFSEQLQRELERAKVPPPANGPAVEIRLNLTLNVPEGYGDAISREMSRIADLVAAGKLDFDS